MNLRDYVSIARPDHWFKNVFLLPGVVIAAVFTAAPFHSYARSLLLGVVSACCIASANYVVNEWLDAKYDRFHPAKKRRPGASGRLSVLPVFLEYALFLVLGFAAAVAVSTPFLVVSILFAVAGVLYNMDPVRTKDRAFLDVLSESLNNPIRLLLGWFVVTREYFPPSSLLLGYWMGGAFLMGMKRYAEFRSIADLERAAQYRRSFRLYTEQNLLISSYFYSICAAFFFGAFLVKYRVELLLSLPFLGILFTWYFRLAVKPDSPVQHPEKLHREKAFFAYAILVGLLMVGLFVWDIPWMSWFLNTAFTPYTT